MAAAATQSQNPAVKPESKSAKKKKAKAPSAEAEASATPTTDTRPPNSQTESNSGDSPYESPYIKELYKSIRNVNKKIANASKVDSIVAENSGKTLDQLVSERKINADQKAQILKKPALQASLAQLEEQIAQYKKFDQEYKAKSQAEKTEFEKTLTERASRELEDAVTTAKTEAVATARKEQESNLLLLSQFLRLAAIRRGEDEDPELEENKALEGLLARVYTGDANAVGSMLNLIDGSGESVASVNNEVLSVSYADIKRVTLAQTPPVTLEAVTESISELEVNEDSDTTIPSAGVTAPPAATTNGHIENVQDLPKIAANAEEATSGATDWDTANDLSASQEWVKVPRDDAADVGTGVGVTASPSTAAVATGQSSWADELPDSPAKAASAAPPKDDGFHEVHRSRGGRDRGQYRGRGGRGDGYRGRGGYRGDGFRGGRGRGSGGGRGGAPRRPDES